MSKKLFVGFDLGDGETSMSIISPENRQLSDIRMPTTRDNGQPIATAYGKNRHDGSTILGQELLGEDIVPQHEVYVSFKQKPSEILNELPPDLQKSIHEACEEFDVDRLCALFKKADNLENGKPFMPKCVRDFVDAIFTDSNILRELLSFADKCKEAAVFVGHPTKWDKKDVLLYEAMLRNSVLGKGFLAHENKKIPIRLHLEKESRAAFLNGKRKYKSQAGWDIGKYTLVLDIGSSTTDVTAVDRFDVDSMHDDGDTKLGARLIDEAVYEYYRNTLQGLGQLHLLDESLKKEPLGKALCILACRIAKEEFFSTSHNFTPRILTTGDLSKLGLVDIRMRRDHMVQILNTPIKLLENQPWSEYFRNFLKKQKKYLKKEGKVVERIILTGGAARMDFVRKICSSVFGEKATTYYDENPGMSICRGLALVGESNERSLNFQKEAREWINIRLPALIRQKIPLLSSGLSKFITELVLDDIAYTELMRWRSGFHRTLEDTIASIKLKCSKNNLGTVLVSNPHYQTLLRKWVESDIIPSINDEILFLCKKFDLRSIKTSDVDIKKVQVDFKESMEVTGLSNKINDDIMILGDVVAGVVSAICGIISLILMKPILSAILVAIYYVTAIISKTLAWSIFLILSAIPGIGWTLLIVMGAVTTMVLITRQWHNLRSSISEKITTYNLPKWVRELVGTNRLKTAFNEKRKDIENAIKNAVESDETANELSKEIASFITPQVEVKLKEIRYIIESK